jgi:hypothetical protein
MIKIIIDDNNKNEEYNSKGKIKCKLNIKKFQEIILKKKKIN